MGHAIAEKHASGWEILKRAIYATGIFMFSVLAYYCIHIIKQNTFGGVYLLMSVLNGVCLIRSFSRKMDDENGVPKKHQRKPRNVGPVIETAA
ncbi:MAG: hypothetical protein ACI8T1_002649 [Verrucomicrobiales bacterium]|jgi:hypothetical protein